MKSDSLRYLYGGTSMSFVIRMAGVGLLFIANVLLARTLSMQAYGQYAYIVELAAFGAVITCLGFDQIAIRVVPDLATEGNRAGLRAFLKAGAAIAVAISTGLGLLLFAAFEGRLILVGFSWPLVGLAAGLLTVLSVLRFGQEALRARKRIVLSQVFEQLAWPLTLVGMGGAMFIPLLHTGVQTILLTQIGVYLLGIAILFGNAGQIERHGVQPESTSQEVRPIKGWLALGLPLALSSLLSLFLNRGDILALGVAALPDAVASYAAASRYAALMILGLGAASAASGALMREYWRVGDRASLQACVDRTTNVAALFALPLVLLFIIAPETALSAYGPNYTGGAAVLRILATAQLINALSGPVATIVVVCDMQRQYSAVMAFAGLLMFSLLALLVPVFGALGAAVSTFASLILLNLSLALIVYKRIGLKAWMRPAGLRLIASDLNAVGSAINRALARRRGNA